MGNDDFTVWHGKGSELYEQGRFEEALKAFEQAIHLDMNSACAWLGMGNALKDLGRIEEALKAYERAIELDGNFASAWNNKGVALRMLGCSGEAFEAFERAVHLDKNDPFAWNGKGNALNDLGLFDKALEAYERAIYLDKNSAFPWNNKGNVLYEQGRFDEALEAYERAIHLDKNWAPSWNGKGNTFLKLDNFEESLKAYEQAIHLDMNLAPPWNGKGNALNALGRFDEALKAFERAIYLDCEDVLPWNGKGNALQGLERFEEARRALKRFVRLAKPKEVLSIPSMPLDMFRRSDRQAPLLLLCLVARTPGLLAKPGWFEAVRDLKEAYAVPLACLEALDATDHGTPNRLRMRAAGCLAFHLGDPVEAEDGFSALDDHFPEDLLGQYYLVSSRHDYWADTSACLADATRAAEAYHGDDPEQLYYAARIFAFAGKNQEAPEALQNSGNYAPALLLRYDMAKEQGDTPAMVDLARRFLDLERATPPEWRFLHPTSPETFDLSVPDWLMIVLQFAKQQELAGEVQAFLENLDEPPFFELRHAYADVLLDTHLGAWDLKTAWNLDAASRALIDGLMTARDEAVLAELRSELEVQDVNLDKIEAIPDDKLEDRVATRLEDDKASFDKECRLIVYLYKTRRLTFQVSFILMLYMMAKEDRKSSEDIQGTLFDAYKAMASAAIGRSLSGGTGAFHILGIPEALAIPLATGALAGIASFVWRYRDSRKKAALEAVTHDLDYLTFKADLRTFLEQKRFDLPEVFWELPKYCA